LPANSASPTISRSSSTTATARRSTTSTTTSSPTGERISWGFLRN